MSKARDQRVPDTKRLVEGTGAVEAAAGDCEAKAEVERNRRKKTDLNAIERFCQCEKTRRLAVFV